MYIQYPYNKKFPGKNLRFTMFELRILVNQITERDVVEIMFSTDENVEFLVQYSKLTTANQTANV